MKKFVALLVITSFLSLTLTGCAGETNPVDKNGKPRFVRISKRGGDRRRMCGSRLLLRGKLDHREDWLGGCSLVRGWDYILCSMLGCSARCDLCS